MNTAENIQVKINSKEADKYRLCPKCGNFCRIEEEQKFCIVCGEKMIEECPNCKEPLIYPTDKYCFKCRREDMKQGERIFNKKDDQPQAA